MAIVTLKREMSEEILNQLIEAGRYATEHPEILTGDNIGDMTPDEIESSNKVFDSFTPEQWARWRAQRKTRRKEERENSEKS